jgi:hypothetical protein
MWQERARGPAMHGCFSAMVPVAALGTENDRGRSLELPQASRSNGTSAEKQDYKITRLQSGPNRGAHSGAKHKAPWAHRSTLYPYHRRSLANLLYGKFPMAFLECNNNLIIEKVGRENYEVAECMERARGPTYCC